MSNRVRIVYGRFGLSCHQGNMAYKQLLADYQSVTGQPIAPLLKRPKWEQAVAMWKAIRPTMGNHTFRVSRDKRHRPWAKSHCNPAIAGLICETKKKVKVIKDYKDYMEAAAKARQLGQTRRTSRPTRTQQREWFEPHDPVQAILGDPVGAPPVANKPSVGRSPAVGIWK